MNWVKFGIGLLGACLVAFCVTNKGIEGCPYNLGGIGVTFGFILAVAMLMSIVDANTNWDE